MGQITETFIFFTIKYKPTMEFPDKNFYFFLF